MYLVVINNMTGTRLTLMDRRIKSLREKLGTQEFLFESSFAAKAFADAVNMREQQGMEARYTGERLSKDIAPALIKVTETVTKTTREEGTQAELKNKNIKELKAICKKRGLKRYSALNKEQLIRLITSGNIQQQEKK